MSRPSGKRVDGAVDHRWVERYSLLSECFKHPTDGFAGQVRGGGLESEIEALDLAEYVDEEPPEPSGADDLRDQYRGLFEGAVTPYAPPAESVYKSWYGDHDGGFLGGPSATDMERRYETIGATPPPAYPVDHIALLLEYASILLEAGERSAHETFLADHLDWVPAFRRKTETAAVQAPFYRWVATVVDDVVAADRDRLGVEPPGADEVAAMVDRASR